MSAGTLGVGVGSDTGTAAAVGPGRTRLPEPRGPLSAAVVEHLRAGGSRPAALPTVPVDSGDTAAPDPWGEDLHLALHLCYLLGLGGIEGVPDRLERDLDLLRLRGRLEDLFLAAVRDELDGGTDVAGAVAELVVEPVDGTGVSHHLQRRGELWQLREYVAVRSTYHLIEADPQAWVVPRLHGRAKVAAAAIQHDEYGAGRPERMHANLFAAMMRELDLADGVGAQLESAPAEMLAETNLMSLFGLRRELRGAAVGQFALIELTSSPGSARLVRAARRLGAGPATERYYDEHVVADAVHEQLIRREVIEPMLAAEPGLAADVVLGIQAGTLVADRLGARFLAAWQQDRSALRRPARPGRSARSPR